MVRPQEGSSRAPCPAPEDPPPSDEAAGSGEPDDKPQSVVAGTWNLMISGIAQTVTLELSGADGDLRGPLVFSSGSPAPQPMTGSFDPSTGVLIVRRANGQPYLELTRQGNSSSQSGKVTTPTGLVTATLYHTPLSSP